jgi:hypothetical protein
VLPPQHLSQPPATPPHRPFGAFDKAQMVIPIQKFMTSIKADIKETSDAIEACLDAPENLQELCLTEARAAGLHTERPTQGTANTRPTVGALPPAQVVSCCW